jgi:hypothetical protein
MPTTNTCSGCKFWNNRTPIKPAAGTPLGGPQRGFCTFHAPTGTDPNTRWPVTVATEGCGDFTANT